MTTNVLKFTAAGFASVQQGINNDGYVMGTTPLTTSDTDSTEGLDRVLYAKTADLSLPDNVTVTITGDDDAVTIFQFPPGELPSFSLEVGSSDLTFGTKTQGTSIYELGDWSFNVLGPNDPDFEDITFVMSTQAKVAGTSGCAGSSGWYHLILPACNVQDKGPGGLNEQGEVTRSYQVTVNKASCFPWGQALTADNVGTTGAVMIEFFAENRFTFQTYIDDGATGSFTLERTPAGDETTNKAKLWRNGTEISISSLSTTTRQISFSAGTSGDILVVGYEYV